MREKRFIGPRLRRLRQSLGLTQSRMAAELGISASYLNLIEGNNRPASANLLLALAETYAVDIASFGGGDDVRLVTDLHDAMRDPSLPGGDGPAIPKTEIEAVVAASPGLAERVIGLMGRARANSPASEGGLPIPAGPVEGPHTAVDGVRALLEREANHFQTLDVAAERLAMSLATEGENFRPERLYGALRRQLFDVHQITVRIRTAELMGDTLSHFDRHARRIDMSELMTPQARCFQLAYQSAILNHADLIEEVLVESAIRDEETLRLARVTLANYFAAAVMMPYNLFLRAADENAYDIEVLGHRFLASFEQVAHRLTTLQRPGRRGVPFFFVRIDIAGNITKRLGTGRFQFSRYGGTCPLWNIHECFQTPGKIFTQIIELPDERPFFSVARTVNRAGGSFTKPAQMLAVGLGCDLRYAPQLVYARPFTLKNPSPVPIGANCRVCDRLDCDARAFAPIDRRTRYDERRRGTAQVAVAQIS